MPIGAERDYRLRWMDFDRYARLKPQAIFDILQDVATEQATEMGIGDDVLLESGTFWVITRAKIQILDQPRRHETVTARTWPHTLTKLSFLRDYWIRGDDGRLLVKATSEWVLMDLANRTFASPISVYDGPQDFDEARSFESKPKKIKNFEEDPAAGVRITPAFSEIDQNGHVNNAMYWKFVFDTLDLGPDDMPTTLQIDYRHEIQYGTSITTYTCTDETGIRVKGVRDDGEIAFMAHLTSE